MDKKKKTIHIISHSHLDREWYMPFERHRYHLIELINSIMKQAENDPKFKSFHLDGQMIPIFDYLEIKENEKERFLNHLKKGTIQAGPWYILQDAFLTSGEANIRNLQLGLHYAKELGIAPVMIGYFPDTFGNTSQLPQILKKFNIECAAFGRGLNEVGFNNTIIEQKGINQSELIWESPDGSQVAAIFFANWYCNACDIPFDSDDAIVEFFKGVIAKAEKFSNLDDLLAMNGCDHTPLRRNIGSIIEMLNKRLPDYNFVHSNFKDYIKVMLANKEKYQDRVVKGEIVGQYTTGYNLLINTASTRVDLKKMNYKVQNRLEKETEPIAALSYLYTGVHDDSELLYAWKKLIENHPHDSICSCSVDQVNDDVDNRFKKAHQMATMIRDEALYRIVKGINNPTDYEGFFVINKHPFVNANHAVTTIAYPVKDNVKEIEIVDSKGNKVPFNYKKRGNDFIYNIPKESFREVHLSSIFDVEILTNNIPPLGWETYFIKPVEKKKDFKFDRRSNILENDYLKITINFDGTYNILNKETNLSLNNQGYFEYSPDLGDEYNFRPDVNNTKIYSKGLRAKIKKIESSPVKEEVKVYLTMKVPGCVHDKRVSRKYEKLEIINTITLYKNLKYQKIKTKILNNIEDYRLRVIFEHNINNTPYVYSEGQFDLVKRDIEQWPGWVNPSTTNRMDNFVMLKNDKVGFIASAKGLYEYEVIRQTPNKDLAITLIRCVAELGDWGFFPTPNSQLQKEIEVEYSFRYFDIKDEFDAIQDAYKFHARKQYGSQFNKQSKGHIPYRNFIIESNNPQIILSSFKKAFMKDGIIVRFYNISDEPISTQFTYNNELLANPRLVNLNEEFISKLDQKDNIVKLSFKPKEILTIMFDPIKDNQVTPTYFEPNLTTKRL